MAKKAKDLHNIKKDVRFNSWELKMIERAIHVHGLRTGLFVSLAQFIRGHAVANAYALIRQYNRRSKSERAELEAEAAD